MSKKRPESAPFVDQQWERLLKIDRDLSKAASTVQLMQVKVIEKRAGSVQKKSLISEKKNSSTTFCTQQSQSPSTSLLFHLCNSNLTETITTPLLSKYRSHVPNLFEPFQKYTWDVWIRNEGNVEVTYEGFEILTKTRDAREFLVWEDRPRPVTLKVTEDFKKIHIRFSSETLRQGLFRVTVRFRFRQGVRTHVFEVIKKKKKKRYVVRDLIVVN